MRPGTQIGIWLLVIGLALCCNQAILFFGGHTVENVDPDMRGVVLVINRAFWIGVGSVIAGLVVLGATAVGRFQKSKD